jgi:hypothetical protein
MRNAQGQDIAFDQDRTLTQGKPVVTDLDGDADLLAVAASLERQASIRFPKRSYRKPRNRSSPSPNPLISLPLSAEGFVWQRNGKR